MITQITKPVVNCLASLLDILIDLKNRRRIVYLSMIDIPAEAQINIGPKRSYNRDSLDRKLVYGRGIEIGERNKSVRVDVKELIGVEKEIERFTDRKFPVRVVIVSGNFE